MQADYLEPFGADVEGSDAAGAGGHARRHRFDESFEVHVTAPPFAPDADYGNEPDDFGIPRTMSEEGPAEPLPEEETSLDALWQRYEAYQQQMSQPQQARKGFPARADPTEDDERSAGWAWGAPQDMDLDLDQELFENVVGEPLDDGFEDRERLTGDMFVGKDDRVGGGNAHHPRNQSAAEQAQAYVDEFAPLEQLGLRFPANYDRLRADLGALRGILQNLAASNARIREKTANVVAEDRDRHRRAYEQIAEDDLRDARRAQERDRRLAEIKERNALRQRRTDKIKLQRSAEELQREAKSRRLRRQAKEDALIQSMFKEAFEAEKQRLLEFRDLEAKAMHAAEEGLLNRYDSMRRMYEDRADMFKEQLHKERSERAVRQKERRDALRNLARELQGDFARKLDQLRAKQASEEERYEMVNTAVIERAFALLRENVDSRWILETRQFQEVF